MNSFTSFNLPNSLQLSLEKIQFLNTTPIQEKAIPILLEGQDLIACSETGSGKTAAYVIPMIAQLMADSEKSGLILAPTRELAQQIEDFITKLVDSKVFMVVCLFGGTDIRKQFKKLQKKPRIIVATPGRLIDHLKRNTVQIHKTEFLVLDEGDRMIDMGFAPQLQQILKYLPAKRQTSFFTATIDERVNQLAGKYLVKPKNVSIGQASRPVSSIKQDVMMVDLKGKDECVLDEVTKRDGSILIFLKTKHRTDRLTKYLSDYGIEVDLIHSDRTQGQRNKAISNFKSGKVRVLCATDIAARGIDVPQVEHVINYDLPMQDEDYVHRIGRTARNGAEGSALSFVMPEEHRAWNRLARKYQIKDVALPEAKFEGRAKEGRKKSGGRFKDAKRKSGSWAEGKDFGGRGGGKKRFNSRSKEDRDSNSWSNEVSESSSPFKKKRFNSRGDEGRGFSSRFGDKRKRFEYRGDEEGGESGSHFKNKKRRSDSRGEFESKSFNSRFGDKKKSFESREDGEGRDFKPRFGDKKKKFKSREDGESRDFASRPKRERSFDFRGDGEGRDKESGSRFSEGKKKFKKKPFQKSKSKSGGFKNRSY